MATSYKSKFGQFNNQDQSASGIKTLTDELRVGNESVSDTPNGYAARLSSSRFESIKNSGSFAIINHGTNASSPVTLNLLTVDFTSSGSNGDQTIVYGEFTYTQNTGPGAAVYSFSAALIGTTPTLAASVDLVKSLTGAPTAPSLAWAGSGTTRTLQLTISTTFAALHGWISHKVRNSSGGVTVTYNQSALGH